MFGCRSDELIEHSLMKSRSTCCRSLVLRAPPMARSAASSEAMKNNRLTAILRPLLVHVARLTSPREPAPSVGDDSSMLNSSSGTRHSESAESSSALLPSASHPIQSSIQSIRIAIWFSFSSSYLMLLLDDYQHHQRSRSSLTTRCRCRSRREVANLDREIDLRT